MWLLQKLHEVLSFFTDKKTEFQGSWWCSVIHTDSTLQIQTVIELQGAEGGIKEPTQRFWIQKWPQHLRVYGCKGWWSREIGVPLWKICWLRGRIWGLRWAASDKHLTSCSICFFKCHRALKKIAWIWRIATLSQQCNCERDRTASGPQYRLEPTKSKSP